MTIQIIIGEALEKLRELPDESVHCCLTSPPYFGLRDYGVDGQIGLENTPAEYVANLVDVFREVRRVLRDDGTLWLNLGDSYANDGKWGGSSSGKHANNLHGSTSIGRGRKKTGLKPKDLIGIPWAVAFALRSDGWYLRDAIVWHKPNPMPSSVTDRCTSSYEMVFMMSKSKRYYFDAAAIAETGTGRPSGNGFARPHRMSVDGRGRETKWEGADKRNCRNVWTVATQPFPDAHFAVMAPELAKRCILAGCPEGGTVLDPFGGSGTSGLVADRLGRNAVLIELNPAYVEMARKSIADDAGMFADVA